MKACEGECYEKGHCRGEVRHVRVSNLDRDWGDFWYCERAIEKDRSKHFDVEPAEEED